MLTQINLCIRPICSVAFLLAQYVNKDSNFQMHIAKTDHNELMPQQSELPLPIPRNSMESDHGCTSRIYFDNVGDNVTLSLYNVTLTQQKPC